MRNTLLSQLFIERIGSLPRHETTSDSLVETVTRFQEIKAFASEIHTELHLVKPMLKVLGFAFESKPKHFEEEVKGADYALFRSEAERLKASSLWGTRSYYQGVLGLLMVKRYGRSLEEGISGFYLEFENRIPLYQSLYLTRKSAVPWGVLTNGKTWILVKKPLAFEKSLIEVDLEAAVATRDEESLHLFYNLFSAQGLAETLPGLLDDEREELITLLKERRVALGRALLPGMGRAEVRSVVLPLYGQIFPGGDLAENRETGPEDGLSSELQPYDVKTPVKGFDQCDILNYLFAKGLEGETPDFERIILEMLKNDATKESLLSLRILDMTPGFGNVATRLIEAIAYLSFSLPYREKRSFVAEWENNQLLDRFIVGHVLYGVEKSDFSLDALQSGVHFRFGCLAPNYRLGNPLLGMSMKELSGLADGKNQTGLFSKNPGEVMTELRDMSRLYFSLSDRIKEDAAIKSELEGSLRTYRRRLREVMDLQTASYFDTPLEGKKARELLYHMDAEEAFWESARETDWFREAKAIATRKHFFHMELEFPFLLNERFDAVVVRPAMRYLWEESLPMDEATKAYIKRAMAFLGDKGRIFLIGGCPEEVVTDLKRSKRYGIETKDGVVTVRKR